MSDLSRDLDTGGTPATLPPVRVKYFWDFDMELAEDSFIPLTI